MTFRENALHHGKEVIGDTPITLLDEEHPILLMDEVDLREEEQVLLIHYKASIGDEKNIGDARWFTLDEVTMLDAKEETSSSNVRIVSEKYLA